MLASIISSKKRWSKMLAFSIDYYGIFFRATQSVELFCTYYRNVLPAKFWKYTISASVIPCRITFFLSTFVATYTSHAKKSVALNHTLLRITFVKEFSAGCQPRYPVKIPITTWKSLSPPRGLQLYPSYQARCPVKTSNEMEVYPAPSAAQLLMMLLHREHFCSCFYYTQS